MSNNNASTLADNERNQAMSDKAPDDKGTNTDIESKYGVNSKNPSLLVDLSQPRDGTIENQLMWARNSKNDVMIESARTRKGWNFPSSGGGECKKGVTRKLRQWWCDTCNTIVDYPVLRYWLELDVVDDTRHIVVVLFDEPATALIKCSAESIAEANDEILDDDESLSAAISNIVGTTHVLKIKLHAYYEYGTFESFTCWKVDPTEAVEESIGSSTLDVDAGNHTLKLKIMSQDLSVPTTLKPLEEGKKEWTLSILTHKLGLTHVRAARKARLPMFLIRGKKDSNVEESYGSADGSSKDKVGSHFDKKKQMRYVADVLDSE
uniref:Replication factor A C-terminal domain-containing protein n=1 Tax=Tanacetum cinerariifolium TaxID=118510 RepID=A0A6L2KDY3_TANCI|nr:hypothetical protein [Tanacetum cinerariifolium]